MNLISEDYLMHHGVKGMKWGVRHDPERALGSKRKMKKAFKKAFKEDQKRKGRSGALYTGTSSTGKNYDKVYEQFNKERNAANEPHAKQWERLKKKYNMRYDDDDPALKGKTWEESAEAFEKDVDRINNSQTAKKSFSENKKVVKKYVHQLNQAKLKDIGIKNVSAGERYMEQYGLNYYIDKNGHLRYGSFTYL